MPNSPTPNMGLIVPTPGGDTGIWGNELNTDLGTLDTLAIFPFQNFSANGTLAYDSVRPIVFSKLTSGAGGITVTLPDATLYTGKVFCLSKVDTGAGIATVATTSSQTIGGLSSWPLSNVNQVVAAVTDGANWVVFFAN